MTAHSHTAVQATEPTYQLHSLGWKAFQNLCATIASEIWGQTIQTFFDSRDGGRDGAFQGTWKPSIAEVYHGSFTVQCKFTSSANKAIRLADLGDEQKKAERLASKGLADNYFLFTNARLTGENDEQIRAAFTSIPGIRAFAAFGPERISQIIRESPRLRMLVPRIYGLGDLSQILDVRAYDQAREILSALGDDLAKFVITDAYRRSARALVDHGFVLLLGEPASGKSTIAAALSLGALDEWRCSTIKVRDADEFVRHSNPHEPKQFFWVDDAFGATQLDVTGVLGWNRSFPHISAAIRRGARVVFTSRDYVYRSARNFLKESALPVMRESQVVIKVDQLTQEEREQILYNHVRLGTQSPEFKSKLKPFLPKVSEHGRFSPEIARRLGHPAFTKRLIVSSWGLEDFVAHPMELLQEILRTLDSSSRCAIALIFMRAGSLHSPVTLNQEELGAVSMLGGTDAGVRAALVALEGSLLINVRQGTGSVWRFKHPTIRDAFAALVAENRELLDVYLAGTPVDKLFREVSCGDVGLEGVKVVVPADRYDFIMSRMGLLSQKLPKEQDALFSFLSYRCDRDFLASLLAKRPSLLGSLHVNSYINSVPDVDLIARLHEFGLLPDAERLRHVSVIRQLAVQTPDSGFIKEEVRSLLNAEEFESILQDVRADLLPNLRRRADEWHGHHDHKEDPDEYFEPFKLALEDFREAFADDPSAVEQIAKGVARIDECIAEIQSTMPDEDYGGDHRDFRAFSSLSGGDGSRSIFDDVDQ